MHDPITLPFDFDKDDIFACCGTTYAKRGRRYALEDRVVSIQWEASASIILAKVQGNHLYTQVIQVDRKAEPIHFNGLCSCPVKMNCKHVAAVLFELLEDTDSDELSQPTADKADRLWNHWKNGLHQDLQRQREAQKTAPGSQQTLYLLTCSDEPQHATMLSVMKCRQLKRGGWGKPTRARFEDAFGFRLDDNIPEVDKDIARLAIDPQRTYYVSTSSLDLKDERGGLLLSLLLKSGRCYFGDFEGQPLASGPERTGRLTWQTDTGGRLQLQLALHKLGSHWRLLPTTPACYLDMKAHQIGQILTPYSGSTLARLLTMPTLTPDKLNRVVDLVSEELPELPLPSQLEYRLLEDKPQPVLQLLGEPAGQQYLPLARLQVRYGPVLLEADFQPRALVQQQGQYWSVVRRPDEEWRFLETLSELGLSLASQLGFHTQGERDLTMEGHTAADKAQQWRQLLEQCDTLAQQGWEIELDDSFPLHFTSARQLHASVSEFDNDWFELGLEVEIAGERVALLPLLQAYLQQGMEGDLLVETTPHHWLQVPREVIAPVVRTLVELHQLGHAQRSTLKLSRALAAALPRLEEAFADDHTIQWHGGEQLRAMADKLRHFGGLKPAALPDGLNATLRPYQHQGVSWMQFLREYGFGGILADDMGLGKTLQALTHLLIEKQQGRLRQPALILAPTSVLSNWQREAQRFTPALKVWVSHGPQRGSHFKAWPEYDLIVTSYPLLVRDSEPLERQRFSTVILDEAQQIKNPNTKMARAACAVNAEHRLCLTGTPIENNLGELWSHFHFLMPGFLGAAPQFNNLYRHPIERENNTERHRQLRSRIQPFVLRRTKQQVATELPPKTEMVQTIELGNEQAKLYESVRAATEKQVQHWLNQKGLAQSRIQVLDALLKLRQICCDPQLLKLEQAQKIKQSAKRQQLNEMLEELVAEGRKILVFSQFTSMLALIEADLDAAGISYSKLTGRTRKRDEAIRAFQEGDARVFLISLKAGGTGLNLTAADTVIHYDPWWNPAVEQQATDRAYRIGQDKPVFVYKLITEHTIEEKIHQLQQHKAALADALLEQTESPLQRLDADDLLALIAGE